MKYLNNKVFSVWIFLAATALLIFYLLSLRWHIYLSITFFWIAISIMLGTIIYQTLKIELSKSFTKVVLLEIVVTCVVFHLIYQIPFQGLVGVDAYKDMASAKSILSNGFVMDDPQYITRYSYFPIIHVFGSMLSLITSIDLFSIAKWFPSFLGVALILLLYLLIRSIFKKEKIALLSALLFACLQHQITFNSLFVRQTYALVLGVCCLYLYFSARNSPHPITNYALSILCLVGTVFAHDLTIFMLFIFLLIHFLVTKASEHPFLRKAFFVDNIVGEKVTITFLSIAFAVTFTYWTYVVTTPLYTLTGFVLDLLTSTLWGTRTYADASGISAASLRTTRQSIIFYGFHFFYLIFGLILLYGLIHRVKNRRVETYSSTLFLFLCGLVVVFSQYVVAGGVFPERFLMFAWLFGFAPLVVAISQGKHRLLKRIGILLLVAFMLYNIYTINPTVWDAKAEGIPTATSEEDYTLANAFDFSSGEIFGPQNSVMAIYDLYNNLGTVYYMANLLPPERNITEFDWIIIQKKQLELEKNYYPELRSETIAALERLVTKCPIDYNKIYDSNNLLVFKLRQ
jgi:hypothetical protein